MVNASGEPLLALFGTTETSHAALVTAETGEVVSYGQLHEVVSRLARQLATLRVARGSRVALVIRDGPDFLPLLFAIVSLGATAAPLNPAYKRDEFEFYLADLKPELLLLPVGEIPSARDAAGKDIPIVNVVRERELALVSNHATAPASTTPESGTADDIALLLHTSGTTSRPKQVPLLQRNLMSSARTIASFYDLGADDVSYCAMPLFHVHGLVASTFGALAGGGTVVIPRRFTPRAFWPQFRRHGVTWYSAGPTLHQMILGRGDDEGPPETLRFARSCSSALTPALMERAERTLGVPMIEAYGMTEASHQMASNPLPPGARKPGSVGVSAGSEIRIVDANDEPLSVGSSGEVVIRGPSVMSGYLNNAQANDESFVKGWFRTGDRGVLDDEGYLRLEGRLKEMILRGGENISPYEIEEVLLTHPAVTDAICFGIDDEKYGERVGAAITLGYSLTERELIDYCRERLATFKVPEVVHILDAIPRTATGKVQRKRLGESLSQKAQ